MKQKFRPATTIIICWGASCVIAALLSAIGAYLISAQLLPQDSAQLISKIITAISVFSGAMLAIQEKGRGERYIMALSVAVSHAITMLLCKLMFFPGNGRNIPICVLICIASAMLAVVAKSSKKVRRKPVAQKRRR